MKSKNYSFRIFIIVIIACVIIFLPNINQVSIGNNKEIENKGTPKISGVNSRTYSLEWEDMWGGSEAEYGRGGIAVDDNGYIYVAGSTYSYGSGGYDLCLLKYDGTGARLWTKIWGDSEHQNAHDIAISSSGNIYVTGEYKDIAGIPSDIFLVKFNSLGDHVWNKRWSGSSWNEGFGVAVDDSENIYVSGRSGNDFALLKYDSNGNLLWSKVVTSLQSGTDVALDSLGAIYTVGRESGQAHISKHNSVGDIIWTRFWGGSGFEYAEEMVIDSANNIYFTGRTSSYGAGSDDVFIAKYDSAGSMLWNKTWGTANNEAGYGITLDNETNIYLAGDIDMSGIYNAFTVKFSSAGNYVWNATWGGYAGDFGNRIALNNDGEIYVTGNTNSYGAGDSDIFLLKYNPSMIKINMPHNNDVFGHSAPTFNVEVFVPDLDQMWYTLDNGLTNTTFISNGTIDQGVWDSVSDSIVSIIFYANNTNGIVWQASVSVVKYTGTSSIKQDVEWYRTWGVAHDSDFALDVMVSSADEIYVTGMTRADMGPTNLTLNKFDAQGNMLWAREWGGTGTDHGNGVAVFNNESVFVAGSTSSFTQGGYDVCLIKYDANGNLVWNVTWGDTLHDTCYDVVLDTEGNIYLSGWTSSYGSGGNDALIVKFNSSGGLEWFETWGSSGNEWGESIALDNKTGNVMILGLSSQLEAFIVCYDSSGSEQWSNTYVGLMDGLSGMIVDTLGNIYLSGHIDVASENQDIMVAKLDKDGNLLWNRTWGSELSDIGQDIAIDSNNTLYVTGYYEKFKDQNDVCIVAFNIDGDYLWNFTWGGDLTEYGIGIALGQDKAIYVSGFTQSHGETEGDSFLFKYCPTHIIIINSPKFNELYGTSPPSFEIFVPNTDVDELWYTCDSGLTNITFTSNGTINQVVWDGLPDGSVLLTFYANDTYSSEWSASIVIKKDTEPPSITILSPLPNDFYSIAPPNFSVHISVFNLSNAWYSLNGGDNVSFISNGTIDQSLWESLPDGVIDVRFYANDSAGNIYSSNVLINKDTNPPIVSILRPNPNDVYSTIPPNFSVYISDIYLSKMWYSLNSGENVTFVSNGTIDQSLWEVLPDGVITIRFQANDTIGNKATSVVFIIKDTTNPTIEIITPIMSQEFESFAPEYHIQVTDANIMDVWYTINGGAIQFQITDYISVIDQETWDGLSYGNVSITFIANDTAGNLGYNEVIIVKRQPYIPDTPSSILGFNNFIILALIGISVCIILTKIRENRRNIS